MKSDEYFTPTFFDFAAVYIFECHYIAKISKQENVCMRRYRSRPNESKKLLREDSIRLFL